MKFTGKILGYIRKHHLIAPGDRVGVAVSGGADSVALLRALWELRGELGCVLAIAHFNHKIRPEAEAEAEFVEGLARELGVELFSASGDARKFASQHRASLETAARELRYGFLSQLVLDKVATAHTLDDQAETVLMKLLRGAGTRGLSGIWPIVRRQEAGGGRQENPDPSTRAKGGHSLGMTIRGSDSISTQIIRPMLGVRRKEVEEYLRELGQEWREDASNRDLKHTRNKVRHELLPLLEREYNPNILQQLADAAEVARGEEEFWQQYLVPGTQYLEELELKHLLKAPLAVRRRVVREAFRRVTGKALDFEHTDALVRFLERRESSLLQLPEHWFAVLDWPGRMVRFEERAPARKAGTAMGGKTSKKQGAGSSR